MQKGPKARQFRRCCPHCVGTGGASRRSQLFKLKTIRIDSGLTINLRLDGREKPDTVYLAGVAPVERHHLGESPQRMRDIYHLAVNKC